MKIPRIDAKNALGLKAVRADLDARKHEAKAAVAQRGQRTAQKRKEEVSS